MTVALIALTGERAIFISGILLYSVAEATLSAALGVNSSKASALHVKAATARLQPGAVLEPF